MGAASCANSGDVEPAATVRLVQPSGTCIVHLGKLDPIDAKDPMPCTQIATYLRTSARLPSGSRIGVVSTDEVPISAVNSFVADLRREGFEVGPVMRVGFISEPGGAL